MGLGSERGRLGMRGVGGREEGKERRGWEEKGDERGRVEVFEIGGKMGF